MWTSPWSERAHEWRVKYIKNPKDILPSVLIMQSVSAKKAGVFVHKNLKTDNLLDMFISASLGLGIKVVDGSETPEQWTITLVGSQDPTEKRIDLENAALAKKMYVLDNQLGGITEIDLTPDQQINSVLTIHELEQLDEMAKTIREEFSDTSSVMECEFGVNPKGDVVMFQARPFVESVSDKLRGLVKEFLEQ